MPKVRVYELAKELDVNSKDLLVLLQRLGVDAKNHMSVIEEGLAKTITDRVLAARKTKDKAPPARQAEIPASADTVVARMTRTQVAPSPPTPQPSAPPAEAAPPPRPMAPVTPSAPTGPQGGQRGPAGPAPRPYGGPGGPGPRPGYGQPPRPGFAPRPDGPRPAYGPRQDAGGPPRPYGPRPDGNRPGFAPRPDGPRPGGYGPRPDGPRPFGPRPDGPRPGFGPRPQGPGGPGAPGRPGFGGPRPGMGGGRPPAPGGGGPRFGPKPATPSVETTRRPVGDNRPPAPKFGPPADKATENRPWKKKKLAQPEQVNVTALLVDATGAEGPATPAAPIRRPGQRPQRRDPRGMRGRVDDRKAKRPTKISLPQEISVKELSSRMGVEASQIIKRLMGLGIMAGINQIIDLDAAQLVAADFGVEVEVEASKDLETLYLTESEDQDEALVSRPPVVVIMGHVDHGKTTLLDAIRETKVAAGEAGGITQHIGAYQVELKGKKITFLDTPGHEAFTAMRARGAQVTDVAILVVAADDGVMPQTIEAINHAKAAGVPIIVAINKIDKPNAQPDRVKQELTEYQLVAEEWGGDTIMVPVSALRKEGIDDLLEMILLVAEMKDLKANPGRDARGVIIEAELDKGLGPVATVLVQKGTLKVGDSIVAGPVAGKVRALINDKGKNIKKAGPSVPVVVIGLSEVPQAGDPFAVLPEDRVARLIADKRQDAVRAEGLQKPSRLSLDELYSKIKQGEVKTLQIILKADVQGSVEALKASLERLSSPEVRVNVLHGGVGAITETDVMLASASSAIIIGFNVRPDVNAKKVAEREQIDVRLYRVIYDAIDDVKAATIGMLAPVFREATLGRAEVRQTFRVPKAGLIAGCYVLEGKITRTAKVRILRDNVVVHEGKMESLRRFKDDVKEVASGYECGIGIERFQDIKEGDIIEAFEMEEIKRQS